MVKLSQPRAVAPLLHLGARRQRPEGPPVDDEHAPLDPAALLVMLPRVPDHVVEYLVSHVFLECHPGSY